MLKEKSLHWTYWKFLKWWLGIGFKKDRDNKRFGWFSKEIRIATEINFKRCREDVKERKEIIRGTEGWG